MTGKELQAWRKKQGLTQEELALCLGVIRITITRWETDVRSIPSFLPLALEALDYHIKEKGKNGFISRMSGMQKAE